MYKFAHISDCHLGAWERTPLRKTEISAFYKVADICMKEKVSFIVISGDFFHSNIPNLDVVDSVVKKLKEIHDAGIPIYIVYGSHDYSPNKNSMIDILVSAGLLTKIGTNSEKDGKIKLDFIIDPKTGAKITGMPGRKAGIERHYYKSLDRESLESEDGFKIFVFHSGLDELRSKAPAEIDSMPIYLLPRGFDYYAGGHVHNSLTVDYTNYGKICYAGPSFAGYSRDLESSSKGTKRGFFLVEFDNKITDVKFVNTSIVSYRYFKYDAEGKDSRRVQEDITAEIEKLEVKDKIVVIKVSGELSEGRTSDISFHDIRQNLRAKGAVLVQTNKHSLKSKEYVAVISGGDDPHTIEKKILNENIDATNISTSALKGKKGARLAIALLHILRQDKKMNEKKMDYEKRILGECNETLQLEVGK